MSTAEERMQNEIDELEQENRLLRARNTRLEAELKAVPVLSAGPITSEMANWSAEDKAELVAVIAKHTAPVQEPVAWRWSESNGERWFDWTTDWSHHDKAKSMGFPIEYAYTTPPAAQRQWVDLTDRQIESIFIDAGWSWGGKADMYLPAVREVLKLFKETNE